MRLLALLFLLPSLAFAQGNEHPDSASKQFEHDQLIADCNASGFIVEAGDVHAFSGLVEEDTICVKGVATLEDGLDMRVTTFIIAPGGAGYGGSPEDPLLATITINDVAPTDPLKQGTGFISHGTLLLHGEPKTPHGKVAIDPMAGDISITMAEVPDNWQVGDVIVIAGTRYDGWGWNGSDTVHFPPEDEIRVIDSISGAVVAFDTPLVHNHDTPRGDLKTSVANQTRSVTVQSENPSGTRGHLVCMHAPCDIRYVSLWEMGRTRKDIPTDANNVKGRYPLHAHRTGSQSDPVIFEGNAVFRSPGWGIVHHDSHAIIRDNVTYDTFGAGFVAESGNETGEWTDNLAIYAKGISWNDVKNGHNFGQADMDVARTGVGNWFQGRAVKATGNIAASVNTGFAFSHRGIFAEAGIIHMATDAYEFPKNFHHEAMVNPDHFPILVFEDNEVFAANTGIMVLKANPNQFHPLRTVMRNFTAWSVIEGAMFEYTSHYTLIDFDLIGRPPDSTFMPWRHIGMHMGGSTLDMSVINPRISGFHDGIKSSRTMVGVTAHDPNNLFRIVNPDVTALSSPMSGILAHEIMAAPTGDAFAVNLDPMSYYHGDPNSDPAANRILIRGSVTDSLGTTSLPGGADNYDLDVYDVQRRLNTDGYWTSGSQEYLILDMHFSDRGNGDIWLYEAAVPLNANVNPGTGLYPTATDQGPIDPGEYPKLTLVAGTTPEPEPEPEPPAPDPDPEPDPDLQAQLDAANAAIAQLQGEIATLETEKAAALAALADSEAAVLSLSNSLTAEQDARAAAETARDTLQAEMDAARGALQTLKEIAQ